MSEKSWSICVESGFGEAGPSGSRFRVLCIRDLASSIMNQREQKINERER